VPGLEHGEAGAYVAKGHGHQPSSSSWAITADPGGTREVDVLGRVLRARGHQRGAQAEQQCSLGDAAARLAERTDPKVAMASTSVLVAVPSSASSAIVVTSTKAGRS